MKKTRPTQRPVDKEKWQTAIGDIFSYLTVVSEPFYKNKRWEQHVTCRCECGKTKSFMTRHLKMGKTKSCGCKTGYLVGQKVGKNQWATNGYKVCAKCRQKKLVECYTKDKTRVDGFLSNCKSCQQGIYVNGNYGITEDEYNQFLASQNGCCAICSKPQSEISKRLAVDHDHSSGEVRGLLCSSCNRGIGYLKDSVKILQIAIQYLSKSNAPGKS